MGAAARQNLAAFFGRHAMPEAMPAFADDFARLVGALHGDFSGKTALGSKVRCFYGGGPRLSTEAAGTAAGRPTGNEWSGGCARRSYDLYF
jgi:hypothetical protein